MADRAPYPQPGGLCSFILPFSQYLWPPCSVLDAVRGPGAVAVMQWAQALALGAGTPMGVWTVSGKCACVTRCRALSAVQRNKARQGLESDGGLLLAQPPSWGLWYLLQMALTSNS